MAPADGTDPAFENTPIPEEGDGSELLGLVIDGRYRLDDTLGRGGMGLVFRATHLGLRRQVAVKILHPTLANSPDVKSRFEREALAVGLIDHPNCVSTYDVGRLPDGALYLAMELLEGKSLADILETEAQLAPGRALHILAHILRGLGAVHAAGLIHRDIKPENIFLIRQGDDLDFAKILDFGIAKPIKGELADDNVRLTQAGMAFGTPIYMAPEQALGNPMDGRADLYAAAVIAYEMLCGQPPFYSEDKLEVMSMHTAKPVPPMRNRLVKRGKPVPSSIEKLILRGLTKKPGDRYQSAEVFLSAVEHALETPEGGQTSVEVGRVPRATGSQPLVGTDGELSLEDNSYEIGGAIEEALAVAPVTSSRATPPRGAAPTRDATPTPHVVTKVGPPPGPAAPVLGPGDAHGRGARGGVGIGLPFTGPTGEPIFGLTPDQRLAQGQAARRKRILMYGGTTAAAVVIGVIVALVTRPSQKNDDASTPAGAAAKLLKAGDIDGAIASLESQKDKIQGDAQAWLVLGHAYSAKNDAPDKALLAYRTAMAVDSSVSTDKRMRASLRTMAADQKNEDLIAGAFDVWIISQDEEAKTLLFKALESSHIARRHAAISVLDRHQLGGNNERIKAYSLDLQDQPTCPARAEAVAKLRAIGDPQAIPALQRAIEARGKTGAYRNKPINGCLIDDAKAAIGFLENLKKK